MEASCHILLATEHSNQLQSVYITAEASTAERERPSGSQRGAQANLQVPFLLYKEPESVDVNVCAEGMEEVL